MVREVEKPAVQRQAIMYWIVAESAEVGSIREFERTRV
jgi:hypothetical protein